MATLNFEQLPSSLEEVVSLILQLYAPGAQGHVAKVHQTLQQLQRSPEGWQLAQSLLGNKTESVRFFGALTFIVKLNTDSTSLSEKDAQALLQNLTEWLIRCSENGEGNLVLRKLCSALVAYFIQFSDSWTKCVKHVMFCLCAGRAVPYGEEMPATEVLLQNLSNEKATVMCWLATTLVEEISKTDVNSTNSHKYHNKLTSNADDVSLLIAKYITNPSSGGDTKIRQEAMKCYQAWVNYSHRTFVMDTAVPIDPMQKLAKHAIMSLADDSLYEIAIEIVTDCLTTYARFLLKDDYLLLYDLFDSPWAQARYERLVNGDFDFDSMQFGHFLLAFGDATVLRLAKMAGTETRSQHLLSLLVGLLGADGLAVSEDKIFVPTLEFWSTYVESLIDETYSNDGGRPPWFEAAQQPVMQAIQKCWRKIQFPSTEEFNSWDSADRTGFKDARRDVADMLQQFYLIKGISFLNVFIKLSEQSIASSNWTELEASLFCLAQFSDCIKDDDQEDSYLHKIFSPALFYLITSQQHAPLRASHVFLTLIREYCDYFKRHTANMPQVLNVAFGSISSPLLGKPASLAIVELCSSSRSILIGELSAFLQQLEKLAEESVDGSVKEGVMEGIGSIIQAMDSDDAKIAPLEKLLSFVEADAQQCQIYTKVHRRISDRGGVATGASDKAVEFGVTVLRCLKGMAKGLQAPDDKPVDIDDITPVSLFWTSRRGAAIQQRILSIMNGIYQIVGKNSAITEEICFVFRNGFREDEPGPFVFPPGTVAEFLIRADLSTPQLELVITTAGLIIKSHKSGEGIVSVTDGLLKWVTTLLQSLGEPSTDPEIAQSGIEFLNRVLLHFPTVLLSQDPSAAEFLFMFTLKALTDPNPLPKQSSTMFWTSFLSLPPSDPINNALTHLGPLLAQALVWNIAGGAARSDLDRLCEPIKKLVGKQVRFRGWFEVALLADGGEQRGGVGVKERQAFLTRLVSLRGSRATNQAVREFWLACRGSEFAYAS